MSLKKSYEKIVVPFFWLVLFSASSVEAFRPEGIGVRVGVDLSRHQAIDQSAFRMAGGQFDTARLILGGHLDLGSFLISKLHLVPSVDLVLEKDFKIFSLNGDMWYFFHQGPKTVGYVGGGWGTHLRRSDGFPNDTKISLNIPLGFQKKLSQNMLWFGEMKVVIADDEQDSSLRLSLGFVLGRVD